MAESVDVFASIGWIAIRSPFSFADRCGALPAASWSPTKRLWLLPATPASAASVVAEFDGEARLDATTLALAERWAKIKALPRSLDPADAASDIPGIRSRPWRHQIAAWRYASEAGAALLDMGMGTGKSLCAIALAASDPDCRRVLICAPTSVLPVWPRQFALHCSRQMHVVNLDDAGSLPKRLDLAKSTLAEGGVKPAVLLLGYGTLSYGLAAGQKIRDWIASMEWDLVVADESQKIKAPGTTLSKFFARLTTHSKRRLCLTGTPLPNSPLDAYGQFRFLDPGIFGTSFTRFRARYAVVEPVPMQAHAMRVKRDRAGRPMYLNQAELAEKMAAITFSARTEDVLDLPPATSIDRYSELGQEEARVYKELKKNLIAEVKAGTVTAANAMVRLVRLQQCTSGFAKTENDVVARIGSSKSDLLREVLDECGAEPVVCFARFHMDLDAIAEAAEALGRSYVEISGRRNDIASTGGVWSSGDVLGAQIHAGGLGMDFTRARYCVHYSLQWSPGDHEQANARVRRPGQTRPVTYVHLLARGTVDEIMKQALENKREVVEEVLSMLSKE